MLALGLPQRPAHFWFDRKGSGMTTTHRHPHAPHARRSWAGLDIQTHQRRTTDNYLALRDLAPDLPIIPVIQGRSTSDYLRLVDRYHRLGVSLAPQRLVGIGSVCRRQHTAQIHTIIATLHALGLRLHGFGVKTGGLTRYGPLLTSADSMAWSYAGRHTPGCRPGHRSESNCSTYALAYYHRIHKTTIGDRAAASGEFLRPAGVDEPLQAARSHRRRRTGCRR